MRSPICRRIFAAFLLLFTSAQPASSQLTFPLAAPDAAGARQQFDQRAETIIRTNACGREHDYARIRQEQKDGEYDHQGEDLLAILIAKSQWLLRRQDSCVARVDIERPKKPDGTFEHATLEELVQETLKFWRDPNGPTNCAVSAGSISAANDKLTVGYSADRNCLKRQINEAVLAMKKHGRMGTATGIPFPCIGSLFSDPLALKGDYDATVKDLVRLFYMSKAVGQRPDHSILDPRTVDYMFENLLSARLGLGKAQFSLIADCDDIANESLGSPEDTADRDSFGHDLLEAIGDVGSWLGSFFTKGVVLYALASIYPPAALLIPIAAILDYDASILEPPFDLHLPETENHRLMIETSRFLTNAAIIAHLRRVNHDNLSFVLGKQREVREWLLQELRRIATRDFDEYNARPYTRYSLLAILNLYDFSGPGNPANDRAMRDAARIVLDLSEAKFAAASNRGRRIVPFRRLADNDGSNPDNPMVYNPNLYERVSGADHEVVRAFVLSGQTQPLETVVSPSGAPVEVRSGAKLPISDTAVMVYAAASSYRLPDPILELAVERKLPYRQFVRHAGVEAYYSSPAFTMSIGGVKRPAALNATIFRLDRAVDRGVAMPTALIPTNAGPWAFDTFYVNGVGIQDERSDNLCGWKGFICGVAPVMWSLREPPCKLTESISRGQLHFVNSANCGLGKPHFFFSGRSTPCDDNFCPHSKSYGFMEIVEAPDPSQLKFDQFVANRRTALIESQPDSDGVATYRSWTGDTIQFQISEERSQIRALNGVKRPIIFAPEAFGVDPFYLGAAINAAGGKGSIGSPWGQKKIEFDFTNWRNPKYSQVDIPHVASAQLYALRAASTGGALEFFKHLDAEKAANGTEGLAGPVTVGTEWDRYSAVTAAVGSAVIYAMEPNGDLWWLRHDGFQDGSPRWSKSSERIGNGWNAFDKIIAGEDGVIYGRLPDGSLRWHRHLGHADGSKSWVEPARIVRQPSDGWRRFKEIFASSGGVLYGIESNGDLRWHKHEGHLDGASNWAPEKPRVGNGWQDIRAVLSAGRGVIYAIWPTGELVWYRHLGHATGENIHAQHTIIDTGWSSVKHMFALSPLR